MSPRNRPPDHLPTDVRDHPAVIIACRERDIGKLFRIINNLTDTPTQFTQSHIARRCELTPSRVAEYMNGQHHTMSVEVISRVADGLGIPGARFGLTRRPWEHTIQTTDRTPTPLPTADARSQPKSTRPTQPNDPLRARRRARGWTQQQAADAIANAVTQATGGGRPKGIDAQFVSRLERGEIRWPNADYRAALRTVYGAATDAELGLNGIRDRSPSISDADTYAPGTVTAIIERTTADRPEVTLLTAAQEAADFASWAERLNTGDVAIASLNIRARELAAASLTMPPAHVASHAAALNREAFTLLKGHHKPHHARDLYAIAAQTCALLAWLSGDLGALDAATLQGSAAQVCADHADHPEVSAWVAVVRSKTAFWRGDYLAAAQLARHGASFSPPGTAAVMLACQEADAYSKLGAADRATESLRRADEAASSIRAADTIGGLFSCEPARHANYSSGSYLLTGRPDLALAEADRALVEFSTDTRYGFGTIGQVHITRTLAFIASGDLDGAAQAVRPVLDLPDERRLATLKDRLRSATSILGRRAVRGSAVAAPLRAEITEFCGVSSAQRQLTMGTHTKERS